MRDDTRLRLVTSDADNTADDAVAKLRTIAHRADKLDALLAARKRRERALAEANKLHGTGPTAPRPPRGVWRALVQIARACARALGAPKSWT